jgi:Putative peptidoglycan binding domain
MRCRRVYRTVTRTVVKSPATSKEIQIPAVYGTATHGYDPGPIDNVLGAQTREALKKLQQAEGLPSGGLNLETLAVLGVEG